jgi:hypothetical protein
MIPATKGASRMTIPALAMTGWLGRQSRDGGSLLPTRHDRAHRLCRQLPQS